jgi:hypothetical protein
MKTILKSAVLIALLLAGPWVSGQGNEPPTGIPSAMEGRIANLELMRENLQREVELHKQELGQQVKALENQSLVLFLITSVIAGIGTITILISFWKGVGKAKQLLLSQAEGLLEEEVKKRLPELTDQKLKAMIAAEMEPFLKVAKRQRGADSIKAELSILVVGEDETSKLEGEKILRGLGFDRVKGHRADGNDLPPSQVYFFNLFGLGPDEGRKYLKDGKLNGYIDNDPKSESAFFFYTNNHRIHLEYKAQHKFVGFANREAFLEPRLIELLILFAQSQTV